MDLGRFGIWWSGSWASEKDGLGLAEVAGEMESLGYLSLWMSAGFEPGIRPVFSKLLAATTRATVATGILSVWPNEPGAVATRAGELGERFLLGIGASHAGVVEASGTRYERPYHKVAEFLDGLDVAAGAEAAPAGSRRRILAALGPRMCRLGAERSLGAHPYFVPLEHTVRAREVLGRGPLLAPEVAVVLEADPGRARQVARGYTAGYLALPNYANNLVSLGFEEEELSGGGSDRLVDAVVPWGRPGSVAARLREHLDAGADHVSVQVVGDRRGDFPLSAYRELAAELF